MTGNSRPQIADKPQALALVVLLVAVVVRASVGWLLIENLESDPDAYQAISQSIRDTGVYGLVDDQGIARPTAFRPPLYPWLLSFLPDRGDGFRYCVVAMHALLGGWTVLATFLISRNWVMGAGPVLAAALVLFDPILITQSTLVMTETLATALSATIFWWCAVHRCDDRPGLWSMILGVLLALAYLCRPTFLVWAVLLVAALAVRSRRQSTRWSNLFPLFIPILIVAGSVGAWTIRNQVAIGHPVWATTHGGYTLLLGNNSMFYDHLRTSKPGDVWNADPFLEAYQNRYDGEVSPVSEQADDQRAYEEAKLTIQKQPGMFVYSCFVRLARLWSPLPHQVEGRSTAANIAVGLFYTGIDVLCLVGLFKLRRHLLDRFMLAGLTLALTLSLVHSVYWSNMRMRAPVMPALAVMAAAGLGRSVGKQPKPANSGAF